jgi:hypothetical protein
MSGIGVQKILPRTATGWRGSNPAPDQNNDSEADGSKTEQIPQPPSPGTGRVVDKTA